MACLIVASLATAERFIVFGDWGGQSDPPYTTPAQLAVSAAMAQTSAAVSRVFALGDNFYNEGVDAADARLRFNATFEEVYSDAALDVPWHVIAGNHDHKRDVRQQIAYSNISRRWDFPSLYYSRRLDAGRNRSVEVFLLDTVVWAGDWDLERGHEQPIGAPDASMARAQLEWLEQGLASSTADWVVVMGHYPVYSIAEHGPTALLVLQLQPLLAKYGVAAYFCGHEHNLQHLAHDVPHAARRDSGRQVEDQAGQPSMEHPRKGQERAGRQELGTPHAHWSGAGPLAN